MNTWITSDLHFGHANIMKFCPKTRARFNGDVNKMNEMMVREWNTFIQPEDLVYILGDVAFLPAAKAVELVSRCNGSKVLVAGNHDRKLLQSEEFRDLFVSIHDYLDLRYDGHKIVMFHYPIAEWDQVHKGSLHFHGHLHGHKSGLETFRCLDVGMDATGQVVISMQQAINKALKGEIKKHHA